MLAPRWRTLVAVAASVFVLDQWTKMLAVAHLTPGVALAHRVTGAAGMRTHEDLEALVDEKGALEELRDFYTTSSPCTGGGLCPRVRVVEGFWDWHYAENPGAAWSMFAHANHEFRTVFLAGFSIVASLIIIGFVRKLPDSQRLLLVALSLILGGALGNLADRVRLGYVIDFIEWYSGTWRWPTFNVADAAISSGIALWALDTLLDLWRPTGSTERLAPPTA